MNIYRLLSIVFAAQLTTVIVLADEPTSKIGDPRHTNSLAIPKASSLRAVLEGKVYQDLVETHRRADERNSFALYCLAMSSDPVHLISLFTNSTIRIEVGTNSLLVTENYILDKVTNKSARCFGAKVVSISKTSAEVRGDWYTGPRASETIAYHLKLRGSNWVIVRRNRISVS